MTNFAFLSAENIWELFQLLLSSMQLEFSVYACKRRNFSLSLLFNKIIELIRPGFQM